MSSNNDECKVNVVRILQLDNTNAITYKDNVIICSMLDVQRSLMYLRIKNNGQNVFTQEFSGLEWIHESSMDGVTTIRSSKATIVIIYDGKNQSLVDFFVKLKKSLTHGLRTPLTDSTSSQSNKAQLESMIDSLVKSINSGDSNKAADITQKLATSRANVQFSLISKNDNQEKNVVISKSNTDVVGSTNSVLELKLRIECSVKKDPIIAPISVRLGTTLRSLKQQIEKETNIKCADQYWFAFERYPISDEYIFGSSIPFVSNQNQRTSLGNPIRSGDMLIMYIAQMSPYH